MSEMNLAEILDCQPKATELAPPLFSVFSEYPNTEDVIDLSLPSVRVLVSTGIQRRLNNTKQRWYHDPHEKKGKEFAEYLNSEYDPYQIARLLGKLDAPADEQIDIKLFGPSTGGFEFAPFRRLSFGTPSGVLQEIRDYRDFEHSHLYQIGNSYLAKGLGRKTVKYAGISLFATTWLDMMTPPYNLSHTGLNSALFFAGLIAYKTESQGRRWKAKSTVNKSFSPPLPEEFIIHS